MRVPILPRWLRDRQRPLVAALLMFALVTASLGMPVFIEPQRNTSQAYPCMHHRCGCGSAEACWRGCCCMTTAQKLAWAKAHGVTPPEYAIALTERKDVDEPDRQADGGSCCKHDGCEAPLEQPAGLGVGLVLTDDYRRCNGLASLWLTMGHALPPKADTIVPRYQPAPIVWPVATSQMAESLSLSPATPPPRHS
ncbi:MAG: hypothetical protein IAF94_20205 [Pirellulaceae bacterium]|nr:hypothetical protein [Pirellulaceae bacterium]